ncbi:MAG: ABC transporter substrate-binding protein [Campylobacterota bacterium]|nr:ABC transporter substrate-binding protein [Campylobacterota bacterium]
MNFIKKVLIICSTFIFIQNISADEQKNLQENFLKKIDNVILIVEDTTLNKQQRNTKIVDTLTPIFDFELMAKLSLGRTWKTLNSQNREKFIDLYIKRMKQSYSSKIDAYKDEKVVITKINQPKSNRIALVTNLINTKTSLQIEYKFYKPKKQKDDKSDWLIYDVVILGVSVIKTDKIQFKEFLQTHNISQLMDNLSKKL